MISVILGSNFAICEETVENSLDVDAEFAAFLEGERGFHVAKKKLGKPSLVLKSIPIEDDTLILITSKSDFKQLADLLIASYKQKNESLSKSTEDEDLNSNSEIKTDSKKDPKYLIKIHPELAREFIKAKEERESFLLRAKFFFKKHGLKMLSVGVVSAAVGAIVFPHYVAPWYSKSTGYKFEGIDYEGPEYKAHAEDGKVKVNGKGIREIMKENNARLDEDMKYMNSSLQYSMHYMSKSIVNSLLGIPFRIFPDISTYGGGAKLGAIIGLFTYYSVISGTRNIIWLAQKVFGLPNHMAEFVGRKVSKHKSEIEQLQELKKVFAQELEKSQESPANAI